MKTSNSEIKCFRESFPTPVESYGRVAESYNHSYEEKEWLPVGFRIPSNSKKKRIKSLAEFEPAYQKVIVLERLYIVNNQLHEIIEEITYSRHLLDLEYDWNCDGGLPLDKTLYGNAIAFLLQYSEYLLRSQKVAIHGPEINLCPNGSLDLSWTTDDARLLINLKKKDDNISGRFYGYTKSVSKDGVIKIEKEGAIDMNSFDETLAVWMKCLA